MMYSKPKPNPPRKPAGKKPSAVPGAKPAVANRKSEKAAPARKGFAPVKTKGQAKR